jgi:hypothetical protein
MAIITIIMRTDHLPVTVTVGIELLVVDLVQETATSSE